MTILTLQILTTFQVLIWFDGLGMIGINTSFPKIALAFFGYQPWSKKDDLPFLLKPLACYFCTSMWFGIFNSLIQGLYFDNWNLALLLFMSNLIVSRLLDYLLGYQSYKTP